MNINSFKDVAESLNVKPKYLQYILFKKKIYTIKEIPKRSGGTRVLHIPNHELKELQVKLLKLIDNNFSAHYSAHGYIRDKSHITNAIKHKNNRYILNIDLEDFFGSINFARVRSLFINYFKTTEEVATILSNICCTNEGILPQGAPTSPIISNILLKSIDKELSLFVKRIGEITYTRYADDMTFSSNKPLHPYLFEIINGNVVLAQDLVRIINKYNFTINNQKTRYLKKSDRLEVTGIVLNEKVNVNRRYVKKIKAILHSIELDYNKAQCKFEEIYGTNDMLVSLRGMIEYIGFVRNHNNELYDDVFLKLAMRYNRILEERNNNLKRIKINLPSIFSIYEQEIFLDLSFEDEKWTEEVTVGQGTGFICENNNFLTNYHVVDNLIKFFHDNSDSIASDASISLFMFDHYNNKIKLRLKIKELDKKIDYIIFEILNTNELINYKTLYKSNEVLKKGNKEFTLYGFPQYREGNNITVSSAQITSLCVRQVKDNPMLIAITAQILEGNSGGPLLNSKNQVVGIAVKGTNSTSVTLNQVIPISYLKNL